MKRLGLVRTLKGAILFLAAMAALCYAVIFPQRIQEAGAAYNAAWMITPGIVCISISAVPIAIALVLFCPLRRLLERLYQGMQARRGGYPPLPP